MSKRPLIQAILLIFVLSANAQVGELDDLLSKFQGITFEKVETNDNFKSTYELKIRQPIDHSDTAKGFFYQRVFLSHRGFDKLTVIATVQSVQKENLRTD